jgi:hypothetical protein
MTFWANHPNVHDLTHTDAPGGENGYSRPDAKSGSVLRSVMPGAIIVISRAALQTSHDTVVGFLHQAGCAIGACSSGSPMLRVSLERESGSTTAPTPPRSPKRSISARLRPSIYPAPMLESESETPQQLRLRSP